MTDLPTPSIEALSHSLSLVKHIQRAITAEGGLISFARFMELALYTPGLGYYSAGSQKLGANGDFLTAPEISPLFAQCIARQCQQIAAILNPYEMLELGAGSGQFAVDLLTELEQLHCLPQRYLILEVSADLKARQQALLRQRCPHLISRIQWLQSLPVEGIKGIIFANEVLDALPVHRFHISESGVQEYAVHWDNTFQWQLIAPTLPELNTAVTQIQTDCELRAGYTSEMNMLLPSWIKAVANSLQEGIILFCDYGYGRREYYHRDRIEGTLMCHYQHHRHADPLVLVGLQDITAHVDFTAVIESAMDAGLSLAGYTTQSAFLFACGLLEWAQHNVLSPAAEYQQSQAIKRLSMPSQMGEIIKIMGLSKNFAEPLLGFGLHERSRDL